MVHISDKTEQVHPSIKIPYLLADKGECVQVPQHSSSRERRQVLILICNCRIQDNCLILLYLKVPIKLLNFSFDIPSDYIISTRTGLKCELLFTIQKRQQAIFLEGQWLYSYIKDSELLTKSVLYICPTQDRFSRWNQ